VNVLEYEDRRDDIDKRIRRFDLAVTSQDVEFGALALVRLWNTYKLNLIALFRYASTKKYM